MFAHDVESIWGDRAPALLDAPLEREAREAWSGRDLTYNCGQITAPWPLYNYSDHHNQHLDHLNNNTNNTNYNYNYNNDNHHQLLPPYDPAWCRSQDPTLLGTQQHADSEGPTGSVARRRPVNAQSWLEEGLSQQKEYDLAQSMLLQASPLQHPPRPQQQQRHHEQDDEQLMLAQLGSELLQSLQHPPSPPSQHQQSQQHQYQQQPQQQQLHFQQQQQQQPPMMPDANTAAGDRGVPTHVLRRMWAQRNMHEDDNVTDMPIEERTTVMLRNLPNNYTREMLLGMINREGFSGMYDFVYLPIDFRTHSSLGYAFINLVEPSLVPRFWNAFDGYNKWVLPSRKQCFVSWCGPYQGFQAHVERYRRSPVMHPVVPDEFKPAIFKDGQRIAFPQPTRKPRMPRLRNHTNSGA